MARYEELLQRSFRDRLAADICQIEALPPSLNCVPFKISTVKGDFFSKFYIHRPEDPRDRLRTEFGGLSFLWENGIRQIPQPVIADYQNNFAVYSFVSGSKIQRTAVDADCVREAARFLLEVFSLSALPEAVHQPPASEACFSVLEHLSVIDKRVTELRRSIDSYDRRSLPVVVDLCGFLESDFAMAAVRVQEFVEHKMAKEGIALSKTLPKAVRVLSPSDFGFHNALKAADNKFVFIDFEYFGWDDPAKTIADFFLQPAVPVKAEHQPLFLSGLMPHLSGDSTFPLRFSVTYPLQAIKWVLIMLNCFRRVKLDQDLCLSQLSLARDRLIQAIHRLETNAL